MRFISFRWLFAGILALVASGFVQNHVEKRRVESRLTWSDPEQKAYLEGGFLALGGFRGLVADALWLRALQHQEKGRYYELKLLCDLILQLQPTFTQVHGFQADNMSYNLSRRAEGCEDKWYWVRSGLSVLEKGLKRNEHHYDLWFLLGYQWWDRLGDSKALECRKYFMSQVPRLDDLKEEDRAAVFTGDVKWEKGRARPDENVRFAAYYFFRCMQTGNDPKPIRTELRFGDCITGLGHFRSRKPVAECVKWDDWGAEEWWVEVLKRNKERHFDSTDRTVEDELKFCVFAQIEMFELSARKELAAGNEVEAKNNTVRAAEAWQRYRGYFPNDKRSMAEAMKTYRESMARREEMRARNKAAPGAR